MGLSVFDPYGCVYTASQEVYLQNALNLEGFRAKCVHTQW